MWCTVAQLSNTLDTAAQDTKRNVAFWVWERDAMLAKLYDEISEKSQLTKLATRFVINLLCEMTVGLTF